MRLPFLLLLFFSSLQASLFDPVAEQQIFDTIHSSEFTSTEIDYQFNATKYPVLIIHNPRNEILWGNEFDEPSKLTLVVIGSLPLELSRHLKDQYPEIRDEGENCYIDLKERVERRVFRGLAPISVVYQIEDADSLIQEVFSSPRFENRVFYYSLGGNFYRVRILNNPEKGTYTATKPSSLRLQNGTLVKALQVKWDHRYGIIIDYEAPRELIDHLAKLANSSYWDWYFNFKIYNGDYVEYKEYIRHFNSEEIITYTIDTWFNFTENLHESK